MTSFYKTMFQTLSVGLLAISVISCGGSSSSKDKDDDSDSNSTPPHSSILNDGAGAPSSSPWMNMPMDCAYGGNADAD